MKKVVSVSLGSSKRNHQAVVEILGEEYLVERIGTDGSISKAEKLLRSLDGKVEAFGLGGTDLYVYAGDKRYLIKDSSRLVEAAKKTPIVDGSGLKNTLERKAIEYLDKKLNLNFREKKVFLVCALDRFGMAESFEECGASLVIGDLMFALGVPVPIYSLKSLKKVANVFAPIVCKLPFKILYPTGKKQESYKKRFSKYYLDADIIAGDFHYIKKHMPDKLLGKVIITNTVTASDIEHLRSVGVKMLVTTTPNLNGRSFGTNVMEALLLTVAGKTPENMTAKDYTLLLNKLDFKPRVEYLNEGVVKYG